MGEAQVLTGGRVFTGRRYVEALLIDQGIVVAAGPDADVRRVAPSGSNVLPLAGRVVIPGLIDSHLHVSDLTRFRTGLNLGEVRDLDDLLSRAREWSVLHPDGPIVGRGLDVDRSLGGRWPVRTDLDRGVGDRPFVVVHASGHAAIANSFALAAIDLESRTASEREGRLGMGVDGTPNGILYEEGVRWLSPLLAAPPKSEDLRDTFRWLSSFGLTTVASMNVPPEELGELRGIADQAQLPVRLRVYVRLLRVSEMRRHDLAPVGRPGRFRVVGTKGFTDGAFGPRTAWLSEPYSDAPEGSGLAVESDDELSRCLATSDELGLAPALHAIGDRAIVRAARLLTPYARREGAPARIEHVGLTLPETLAFLDTVRPALVVQPGFLWSDLWLGARLGTERTRWAYAFRTLADRGHLLAGSSDAPYDPPDPWRGLRAAVERRDELGRSANPDPREALAPEEAVRLYTHNAGLVLGEPTLGSLEPGSVGDLVILEARTIGEAIRIGAPCVRETWVDGERVFERSVGASTETG